MRDAKDALQDNFIGLFGSGVQSPKRRGEAVVRLRTPLYEGEQEVSMDGLRDEVRTQASRMRVQIDDV